MFTLCPVLWYTVGTVQHHYVLVFPVFREWERESTAAGPSVFYSPYFICSEIAANNNKFAQEGKENVDYFKNTMFHSVLVLQLIL